jgi:hypothetical protein
MLTFNAFLGLAVFWLSLCCLCGLKGRYLLFLAVAFFGLSANSMWLSGALKIAPMDQRALVAQGTGFVCAAIAFLAGRFMGRIQAMWIDSRVEDSGV